MIFLPAATALSAEGRIIRTILLTCPLVTLHDANYFFKKRIRSSFSQKKSIVSYLIKMAPSAPAKCGYLIRMRQNDRQRLKKHKRIYFYDDIEFGFFLRFSDLNPVFSFDYR